MGHGQSKFGLGRKAPDSRDQEANALYSREKGLCPDPCGSDTGSICTWTSFLQRDWGVGWGGGGNGGFKGLSPDWTWSRSEGKSVQLWERSKRSTDWIRWFAELRPMRVDSRQLHSDREIYQGKGLLTTQGWDTARLSAGWEVYYLGVLVIVYSLHIYMMNTRRIHHMHVNLNPDLDASVVSIFSSDPG